MDITIDLSRVPDFLNQNPWEIAGFLFIYGGWIVILLALLIGVFYLRLISQRKKYLKSISYTLLAIDVPKDNEQSLVADEQIFATMAGIKSSGNLIDKYWTGKTQLAISLEIISLEGYIQFLIRTPEQYRDLTEAAIYAQYPEAEITEVEDYIRLIPTDVHEIDSNYDLWATEFSLDKHSAYPIKTYPFFEYGLTQQFIDPMASILEVMSKLGPGEQLGWQIVIAPVDNSWKEQGRAIVRKLVGEKEEAGKNLGDSLINWFLKILEEISEAIYSLWGDIEDKKEEKKNDNDFQKLRDSQKEIVKAIEGKLDKICFASTFRIYYLAHNDRFQKGRGVNPIIGAINQFTSTDLNSFKKHAKITTDADYFFVKRRISKKQRKFLEWYKVRSREGSKEFFLSTQELATVYHFPAMTVQAPLLKRTESKKGEAPTTLPLEEINQSSFFDSTLGTDTDSYQLENETMEKDYTITESLPGYEFDNDYYERKFAKNKETINSGLKNDQEPEPPANLPISD